MNTIFDGGRTIEQKNIRRQTLNQYLDRDGADKGRIAQVENDLPGRSVRERLQRFRPILHVTLSDLAFDFDQLGLVIFKYFIDSEHRRIRNRVHALSLPKMCQNQKATWVNDPSGFLKKT